MPFIALALALAVALGGGASIAANHSLPGDALYPIKVGVNEKVENALSFGQEAKAESDIKAAENRLEETEALEAKGTLGTTTQAELNANFDAHVDAVKAHIARLQADGNWTAAAEVAAKFEATVTKHMAALVNARAQANAHAQAALTAVITR